MIRLLFALGAVLGANRAVAGVNIPTSLNSATETELRTRAFYSTEEWSALAEVREAGQTDNAQYQSVLLGSYYHANENLRMGLFYERQYGFRHDEDWQKDPVSGWGWVNPNQRGEDLAILDISPKFRLSFLPGETWTFEFKNRYEYNFFDQDQNIRLKQSLTYHWLREGPPFMSFFLQAEQVFPLNYGFLTINEQWFYLGALYEARSDFQVGVFAADQWQAWASTPQYTAQTGNNYVVTSSSTVLGVLFIFKFTSL